MTPTSNYPALDRSASDLREAISGQLLEEALALVPEYREALNQAVAKAGSGSEAAADLVEESMALLIGLRQAVESIRAQDMERSQRLTGARGYARAATARTS